MTLKMKKNEEQEMRKTEAEVTATPTKVMMISDYIVGYISSQVMRKSHKTWAHSEKLLHPGSVLDLKGLLSLVKVFTN